MIGAFTMYIWNAYRFLMVFTILDPSKSIVESVVFRRHSLSKREKRTVECRWSEENCRYIRDSLRRFQRQSCPVPMAILDRNCMDLMCPVLSLGKKKISFWYVRYVLFYTKLMITTDASADHCVVHKLINSVRLTISRKTYNCFP